jgi:hypothetical protein
VLNEADGGLGRRLGLAGPLEAQDAHLEEGCGVLCLIEKIDGRLNVLLHGVCFDLCKWRTAEKERGGRQATRMLGMTRKSSAQLSSVPTTSPLRSELPPVTSVSTWMLLERAMSTMTARV